MTTSETGEANCRIYPSKSGDGGIEYTHCDGTQLKLADSNLGSEQYSSDDYYEWNTVSSIGRLLFIFPTRVNLTTITLHYYSDNDRGLPELRFFAVPDDFDVWDALLASYSRVDIAAVPPGGEPAGRRNVSVNVMFNLKMILMYKNSGTNFAMSEIEFFTNSCQEGCTDSNPTHSSSNPTTTPYATTATSTINSKSWITSGEY